MNAKYVEKELGGLKAVELPGDPNLGTIVLFHGFGADSLDLFPLSSVYKGPTWIFPQGPVTIPFSPSYVGRAWFPIDTGILSEALRNNRLEEINEAFPPDLNHACAAAEAFLNQLEVPRSRVILGGFSQGAVLAIELALRHFERCAGLLIFSGTYVEKLNWKPKVHHLAKTHFFQSHGTHDPLLPMQKAEELEKILLEGGLQGQLHVFQGGHEIPRSILLKLAAFLKTLFEPIVS